MKLNLAQNWQFEKDFVPPRHQVRKTPYALVRRLSAPPSTGFNLVRARSKRALIRLLQNPSASTLPRAVWKSRERLRHWNLGSIFWKPILADLHDESRETVILGKRQTDRKRSAAAHGRVT